MAESAPIIDVRSAPVRMNGKGAFVLGMAAVAATAWLVNGGNIPTPEFPGGAGPAVSGGSQAGERRESGSDQGSNEKGRDDNGNDSDAQPSDDESDVLTIATYNIMIQRAADKLGGKGPEYRTRKAMKLLKERDVDIAALQEVNELSDPYVKKYMPGYESWPEKYEGANAGGGRPILYKKDKFKKVEADYLEIDRYCTKINLPYILLDSEEYGLILVLNFHPTNQGPSNRPCASGNAIRKKNAHEIVAELREITKNYTRPITVNIDGDINATDHIRTNNNKDGDYTLDDLPEHIFKKDGLINTYAMAKDEDKIGEESSTAHDSLSKRTKGDNPDTRTRLDNSYLRAKPGHQIVVLSWENVTGEEGKGVSDHTSVFSKVKIVRKQ